jgi:hypothetical protein
MARPKGSCGVCRHPDRQRVEALRASGMSLDALSRKFKGLHRDQIWRHWKEHVSAELKVSYLAGPATIQELKERAAEENGSILDYFKIIRSVLMGALTASAEAQSAFSMATISGRLVEVLREIGRITGEVERMSAGISVTANIMMGDARMTNLQIGLLAIARNHPGARTDIVALLRGLDVPEAPKPNGAAAPRMMIEGEAVHVDV